MRACARKEEGAEGVGEVKEKGGRGGGRKEGGSTKMPSPLVFQVAGREEPRAQCSKARAGSSEGRGRHRPQLRGREDRVDGRSYPLIHPRRHAGERRRALRGAHLRRHPGVITPYPDPGRFVRACARKEEGAEGVGEVQEKRWWAMFRARAAGDQ